MRRALLIWLLLVGVALADFTPDPRYVEADKLINGYKFVRAREIAEKLLREKPDSFEGQVLMGRVQLLGEGNPGKADYYLRKGIKTMRRQYPHPNYQGGPWRCYADALWAVYQSSLDLEHYHDAIKWADKYDKDFPPARPQLKSWPLMKLGRMKEARAQMVAALNEVKDNDEAINMILNTQGAVEYEAGNLKESLKVQEDILHRIKQGKGSTDAVFYTNAAESARDLLDFSLTEKYLLEGTRNLSSDTYATPWTSLAELYLSQGRQPEAIEALKRHAKHLATLPGYIQIQQRADSQRILGMALLACGYDEDAVKLLHEVALHGDRNSATSTQRTLVRSRNFYFYREALKQYQQRLAEERSFSPMKEWPKIWLKELTVAQDMEAARRECAALALRNGGPQAMVPPFGPKGFNCPWLTPGLSQIFGEGVVAVAASRVIKDLPEKARPFASAILAEAKSDKALMRKCLEDLPPSQVLLRARLYALLAREDGSPDDFQKVLESDPPVLRRLDLALPVQISCQDGTLRSMIASSPRFRSGKGFQLQIEGGTQTGYQGRLLGQDGSVLTRFSSPGGTDPDESRLKLCRELHQRVFAPRVNLSQMDINGLDGSNLAGGQFRVQLEDIVGKKPASESEKS